MTLVSPYGEELATTSPDATGAYDFGEFATQAGYVVRLDVPASCSILGAAEQTVSNAATTATRRRAPTSTCAPSCPSRSAAPCATTTATR